MEYIEYLTSNPYGHEYFEEYEYDIPGTNLTRTLTNQSLYYRIPRPSRPQGYAIVKIVPVINYDDYTKIKIMLEDASDLEYFFSLLRGIPSRATEFRLV